MRKLLTLIIVMLLCASVAWADEPKKIGGGGTAAGTKPTTGTGGSTGALPAAPKPGQQLNALYTKGKEWQVYDAQLKTPPEGYTYAGSFTLTDDNKNLIKQYDGNKQVALTMENNKVTVTKPDGTKDISVGSVTLTNWNGADKFSYNPSLGQFYYDNKRIQPIAQKDGSYPFLDSKGDVIKDSYVKPLSGGGMIKSDAGTVTVSDASGKTVNTFTDKQWAAWQHTFSRGGITDADLVQTAYAIKDLGINPKDAVPLTNGRGFHTDSVIVSTSEGKTTIVEGNIDPSTEKPKGEYTSKTYTVVNGQQSVSHTKDVDSSGKTVSEYTYTDNAWTVSTLKDNVLVTTTIPRVSYDDGKTHYLQLGAVGQVTVVKDPQTGDIKYYGADNKELTGAALDKFLAEKENSKAVDTIKDSDEAKTAQKAINNKNEKQCSTERCGQFSSFGQFLSRFTQYYNQYAGMAGWSSLIFDEKFLADWRNTVNDIMCNKLNLPTKECWVSKICNHYADITAPRNGVLFTSAGGGGPRAVAHIEATKSLPIITPNATYHTYTATFSLTNPHDEPMTYNVRFIGTTTPTWWDAAQTLGKGGTASAIGAAALFKISLRDYKEVCLEFEPDIPTVSGFGFGGSSVNKICNSIVQHTGGAEAPYPVPQANQTNATTGDGAAAAPGGGPAPGAGI